MLYFICKKSEEEKGRTIMSEQIKKEIGNVIGGLADAFQKESEEKYGQHVIELLEENDHLDIQNPEKFSLFLATTLKRQIDFATKVATSHIKIDKKGHFSLKFVYAHYDFLKSHIDSLIKRHEGWSFSTDKSRWLIDSYVKYIITGENPVITEKKYWHPKIGSPEIWMKWMGTLKDLYYGEETEYVGEKKKLIEIYESYNQEIQEKLHAAFTKHEHFVSFKEEDNKKQYTFLNPSTKEQGTIGFDQSCTIGYHFVLGDGKRCNHLDERFPSWFQQLLDIHKE